MLLWEGLYETATLENALDALHTRLNTSSTYKNREYFRPLLMSSCVQQSFGTRRIYFNIRTAQYTCDICYKKLRRKLKASTQLLTEPGAYHLLIPYSCFSRQCHRCKRDLLTARRAKECELCEQAWLKFRDECSSGMAINIRKFRPLITHSNPNSKAICGPNTEVDAREIWEDTRANMVTPPLNSPS